MKFYILAEHKCLIKKLILEVNQGISSRLTSQNMVFILYMIDFFSVNFQDKDFWLSLKNHAEHFNILG